MVVLLAWTTVTIFTNVVHMRTNWGLGILVLLAGCGTIEQVDSAALMRSTDVAVAADAGAAPDTGGIGGAAGAPGAGGMTGTGGAGTGGMVAGTGGATGSGTGGAPSYTCADLLACCDSLTDASQAQLKAQCLAVYSSATTGTTSCGAALAMIKVNGLCP